MEKNIGEQLNKAYDAYRNVCMEKERIKKEMNLKIESYEQEIHDQSQQITKLKNYIDLIVQQPANAAAAACLGPPPSPKPDNPEGWKNVNLSNIPYEQLRSELDVCLLQKMKYKEQLESEQLKSKKLEDEQKKLQPLLFQQNEEIRVLKNRLKLSNEREKQVYKAAPVIEKEVRNKQIAHDPVAVGSLPDGHERLGAEKIFRELKDEFSQIYKLTREQSIRLNRIFRPNENTAEAPMQFSMPVQCTEEPNEEVNGIQKPKGQSGKSSLTSITPRGLAPDDEVTVSVESLSNLSVKFPPNGDDCDFLQSAPENDPILKPPVPNNHRPPSNFHKKPLLPVHFAGAHGVSSDTERLQGAASNLESFKHLNIGNDIGRNTLSSYLSSEGDNSPTPCLPLNSPTRRYINNLFNQDIPKEIEPINDGRPVRGPQQVGTQMWTYGVSRKSPVPRENPLRSTSNRANVMGRQRERRNRTIIQRLVHRKSIYT
uniref:TRAF family member associated NFKB activator n=1 Tax=Leptobrachium leishanense TaxID=445787 RepID=A0A8C5QZ50_9ANUR